MKELDLDAGNSGLKWRLVESGRVIDRGIIIYGANAQKWSMPTKGACRAFVSSVSSKEVDDAIREVLKDIKDVFWAKTASSYGSLVNAYADYASLGVDRWLALIAAYSKYPEDLCVIDCGTAVTVDYVDKFGVHKGGYIAPGGALMLKSLNVNTAALKGTYGYDSELIPGSSTRECIERGVYYMQKAFVLSVARRCAESRIVCTGGGVKALLGNDEAYTYVEDLVLDGLRIVANAVPVN
ncbi:putative transcriptional regulator [Hahella chejuensis KCTC 2396]|uniref:Type III pantothenate kinase n=1 Tax=Hahella chejuensis (strain KCTC 2396) TaxID=349521 RepID=COAX_HAHCH|nr:type III pantothenate kinase [Hahella chejuensis]Q2S8Z5.1 RecName: Full=Type III pantothenate kinase; AltName: Full=PanK-III; AltName: Full=Pantothenic acid kinase [Hahella chejuensis KCTC 2396]ABC32879.1 putative transcriptional regulator [Hahella chejuensis KCTC 2396]